MAGDAFSGTSPVGRYWQARCVGFEVHTVRGRHLGRVEKLVADELVVRRSRPGPPLRFSGRAVAVVDPWQKTLWVTTSGTSRAAVWAGRAARTASAGAAGAKRLGPPARRSVVAGVVLAGGLRRLVPPAKRIAAWTACRLAGVVALGLWLYGVVVYAVVRVSVRVLLIAAKVGARAGVFLYACSASATKAAIASVNSRRLSSHA